MYRIEYLENDIVIAEISSFNDNLKFSEFQILLKISDRKLTFEQQLNAIFNAQKTISNKLEEATFVFRRFFLSDAANQAHALDTYLSNAEGAISIVQQPPLDGTKIAVWCYTTTNIEVENFGQSCCLENNGYRHLWTGNLQIAENDSYFQTNHILRKYIDILASKEMTLETNCIRTWFFVNDIDNNYSNIVKARKEIFENHNLTSKTHYIASTGIGGRSNRGNVFTIFDAYALDGFDNEQIKFLYAKDYLNPTYEYGVTFERGVSITYGDRKHIIISGTASIDNKGNILYINDIVKQTERMLLNVKKLIEEGGANLYNDAQIIIVYLRDIADYEIVSKIFEQKFPSTPFVITHAPVCRPGWLIEMECIASVDYKSKFKNF